MLNRLHAKLHYYFHENRQRFLLHHYEGRLQQQGLAWAAWGAGAVCWWQQLALRHCNGWLRRARVAALTGEVALFAGGGSCPIGVLLLLLGEGVCCAVVHGCYCVLLEVQRGDSCLAIKWVRLPVEQRLCHCEA